MAQSRSRAGRWLRGSLVVLVAAFAQDASAAGEETEHYELTGPTRSGATSPSRLAGFFRLDRRFQLYSYTGLQALSSGRRRAVAASALGLDFRTELTPRLVLEGGGEWLHDVGGRSSDPVKKPATLRARLELGYHPPVLEALGAELDVAGRFEENTNHSTEKRHLWLALGGVGTTLKGVKLLGRVGGYFSHLELDDDLPAGRGFERDQLYVVDAGPALQTSVLYGPADGIALEAHGLLLLRGDGRPREVSAQPSILLHPGRLLGLHEARPTSPYPTLQIGYEYRWFDLGRRRRALDFRHHHELVLLLHLPLVAS